MMNDGLLTSSAASVVQLSLVKAELSDTELVALLRLGDVDAFAILTRRYETRLLRIAGRITKNTEDSEDAVQEALLKAFWRIETFQGQSSFSTWLTRILINTCLMQLRKTRTRPHLSLDETTENGSSWADRLPDRAVDIETAYERREAAELLAQAISGLKPALRSVVDGYRRYDCSMAELAERNGISIAAVKSRMLRARIALKKSATTTAAR